MVAVYTAANVPQNTVWVDVPGQTLEVGALKARSNVLADEVVRYHGEPIALVAAETEDAALAALDAIVVDYEPLPVLDDPERALEPDAPLPCTRAATCSRSWELEEGDVDSGLDRAAAVVENEYRTQFIDHAYLEPEAGVAWRDTDGVITIRAATQVVEHFRDVARILELPDNRVRLITPYVGGGFGGKEDMTVEPYLGIVVALTGRPVRMLWSRQESLLARQNRHAVRMRYRTGADPSGELVAMDVDILSDGGAYALLSALVLLSSTTCAGRPLPVPERPHPGPHRVHESHPVQRHARVRRDAGRARLRGPDGRARARARPRSARAATAQLRRARRHAADRPAAGDERRAAGADRRDRRAALRSARPSAPGRAVGRGFACNLQPYGRCIWLNDWASAWIGFELDGSLRISIGGPRYRRRAGRLAGPDRHRGARRGARAHHDPHRRPALNPLTGTTTATRQLYMSGNAVLKAATELRDALAGVAAGLLELEPELVEFGARAFASATASGRSSSRR